MSIKDLFDKGIKKFDSPVKSVESASFGAESSKYVVAKQKEKERFVPPVDFATASNFAKFGSAELYYEYAFKRIYGQYPYDGTLAEKQEFQNKSTHLDRYVFENIYPRTNGYAKLGYQGFDGTKDGTTGYNIADTKKEYIFIDAGIHTASGGMKGKPFSETFDSSMIYNVESGSRKGSSLAFDEGYGCTIEFWMKKNAFDATHATRECLFEMWNQESYLSSSYGKVNLNFTNANQFQLNWASGTENASRWGEVNFDAPNTDGIADGKWNHYAFTLKKNYSQAHSAYRMEAKMYFNGEFNAGSSHAAAIGSIRGYSRGIVGTIGSLVSGSYVSPYMPAPGTGRTGHGDAVDLGGVKAKNTSFAFGSSGFSTAGIAVSMWVKIPTNALDGDITSIDYELFRAGGTYPPFMAIFYQNSPTTLMLRANYQPNQTSLVWKKYDFAAYADDKWRHFVFTTDGAVDFLGNSTNMKVYVDGSEITHYTDGGTTSSKTSSDLKKFDEFHLGNSKFHYDEVAVWKKHLSAANVTELYNAGAVFDATGHTEAANLESYYRIDGNTTPTITDSKGNNNLTIHDPFSVSRIYSMSGQNAFKIGDGKFSGSLDEFRYWKTERSPKEIGLNYFDHVGGGTNKHDPNRHLGIYYKFNEGITGNSAIDKNVLDYSGRITNGKWVGYAAGVRNTGSAIVLSGRANKEFKDPIVYSSHPQVSASLASYKTTGSFSDLNSTSMMYHLLPSWLIREDSETNENIKFLYQIMASYFDTLHAQISHVNTMKDIKYHDGTKIAPNLLAKDILRERGFVMPDMFVDANIVEKFRNRDFNEMYSGDIEKVKQQIYQNIYNNLTYIYKSKGTEKAFRNYFRCFGFDTELIKLNLYADNSTYSLRDNYEFKSIAKPVLNLNHPDNFAGSVYHSSSTSRYTFLNGQESLYSYGKALYMNDTFAEDTSFTGFTNGNGFTLSFWMRIAGGELPFGSSNNIFLVKDANSQKALDVYFPAATKYLKIKAFHNGGVSGPEHTYDFTGVDDGRWYRYVITYDGATDGSGAADNLKLFVNGTEFTADSTAPGGTNKAATDLGTWDKFQIGSTATIKHWIDDVSIWDSYFDNASGTPEYVNQLYKIDNILAHPLVADNLVSYYTFDNVADTTSTIKDNKGTNHLTVDTPANVSYVTREDTKHIQKDLKYSGLTMECEFILPKKLTREQTGHFITPFATASLFGFHRANVNNPADLNWPTDDFSMRAYAIRDYEGSDRVRFHLSCSISNPNTNVPTNPVPPNEQLMSPYFANAYDNEKWLLAARVRHADHPFVGSLSGISSSADTYIVDFYGLSTVGNDIKRGPFHVSGTISLKSTGESLITCAKRPYVGAHITNFTGDALEKSDAKISQFRFWQSYLSNEDVKQHAYDATSYGTTYPHRSDNVFHGSDKHTPQIDTLAIHWDFATVTGSDSNGKFIVPDKSAETVKKASAKISIPIPEPPATWTSADFTTTGKKIFLQDVFGTVHTFTTDSSVTTVTGNTIGTSGVTTPALALQRIALTINDATATTSGLITASPADGSVSEFITITQMWNGSRGNRGNTTNINEDSLRIENFSGGGTHLSYIGDISKEDNSGQAINFIQSSTDAVDKEFIYAAKKRNPENAMSSDGVQIVGEKEEFFFRDDDRNDNFYMFEKSPYGAVSDEMINMFATVKDFSNLMGAPADRYRSSYKEMADLKTIFFNKVKNIPDPEKYFEYFKWIDEAVSYGIQQMIPASAKFAPAVKNIVESHILERNKFVEKFPYIGQKTSTEGTMKGVNYFAYNWKTGHAPTYLVDTDADGDYDSTNIIENKNCLWQKHRRILNSPSDLLRAQLKKVTNPKPIKFYDIKTSQAYFAKTYVLEAMSHPYRFSGVFKSTIHGGINYYQNKDRLNIHHHVRPLGPTSHWWGQDIPKNVLLVGEGEGTGVEPETACLDKKHPNEKEKYNFTVTCGEHALDYGNMPDGDSSEYFYKRKGISTYPMNFHSASVTSGYNKTISENFAKNVVVTNLHSDTVDRTNEIPMQGPFTETWVGGHQSRHVRLNKVDTSLRTEGGTQTHPVGKDRAYVEEIDFWNWTLSNANKALLDGLFFTLNATDGTEHTFAFDAYNAAYSKGLKLAENKMYDSNFSGYTNGNGFTLSWWMKVPATHLPRAGVHVLFEFKNNSGDTALILYYGDNSNVLEATARYWNNERTTAKFVTNHGDDKWRHYVITFDGKTSAAHAFNDFKLYVDGTEVSLDGSSTSNVSQAMDASNLRSFENFDEIGNTDLIFSLDDIAVWDKWFIPQHVTELYNSSNYFDITTHSLAADYLVSYYSFDHATDSTSNIKDNTASNNHLTIADSSKAFFVDGGAKKSLTVPNGIAISLGSGNSILETNIKNAIESTGKFGVAPHVGNPSGDYNKFIITQAIPGTKGNNTGARPWGNSYFPYSATWTFANGTDKYKNLDDMYSRPEAWRLLVGEHTGSGAADGAIGFAPADYGVDIRTLRYPDNWKKKATRYREEHAKRPVNVKNIPHDKVGNRVGNYHKRYEYISVAAGKKEMNLYHRTNSDILNYIPLSINSQSNLWATTNVMTMIGQTPYLSGNYYGAFSNRSPDGQVVDTLGRGMYLNQTLLADSSFSGFTAQNGWTIGLWLKIPSGELPGSLADVDLFSIDDAGGSDVIDIYWPSAANELHVKTTYSDGTSVRMGFSAQHDDDTWRHYVFTHNGGATWDGSGTGASAATIKLYVDGEEQTSVYLSSNITENKHKSHINAAAQLDKIGDTDFRIYIDDVTIWDKDFDLGEVRELYNDGKIRYTISNHSEYNTYCVSYYSFDNVSDSIEAVIDNKGSNNLLSADPSKSSIVDGKMSITPTLYAKDVVLTLPSGSFRDSTQKNETVFTTRFSAPGGPEIQTRGYLDAFSGEYSPYNAIPYRNLSVRGAGSGENGTIRVNSHLGKREGLKTLLTRYTGHGGRDSEYGYDIVTSFSRGAPIEEAVKLMPSYKWNDALLFDYPKSQAIKITNTSVHCETYSVNASGDDGITISWWMKMDPSVLTVSVQKLFNLYNGDDSLEVGYAAFNTNTSELSIYIYYHDQKYVKTSFALNLDGSTYKHYVFTFDGAFEVAGGDVQNPNDVKFYLYEDGASLVRASNMVMSAGGDWTKTNSNLEAWFSANPSSLDEVRINSINNLTVYVDDVAIWHKYFTQSSVDELLKFHLRNQYYDLTKHSVGSPLSWWTFDHPSDTASVFYDSVSSNNLTAQVPSSVAIDYFGGARKRVLKTDPSFSISCWININSVAEAVYPIISMDSDGTILTVMNGGKVSFTTEWSTTDPMTRITADGIISINKWHHIILTYDPSSTSNNPILYVDGIEISWSTTIGTVGGSEIYQGFNNEFGEQHAWIGTTSVGLGGFFDGYIDEMAIFNRSLTLAEVVMIEGNGRKKSLTNLGLNSDLAAWYGMGDSTDNRYKRIDGNTIIYDMSKHNRHSESGLSLKMSILNEDYPNFHKYHRNTSYRASDKHTQDDPDLVVRHDNAFVGSTLPRSDFQYSWIDKTIGHDYGIRSGKQNIFGYAPKNGEIVVDQKADEYAYFNGTDSYINFGTGATWDGIIGNGSGTGTSKMTFSVWINNLGTGDQRILDFGYGDVSLYIEDDNRIVFLTKWVNTSGKVYWKTDINAINLREWVHLVLQYDASSSSNKPSLYINGVGVVLAESGTAPTGAWYSIVSQHASIGAQIDTAENAFDGFHGKIDNLTIYSSALTARQAFKIYKRGRKGSPLSISSLELWYMMGAGRLTQEYSPTDDTETNFYDLSGNSRNSTTVNKVDLIKSITHSVKPAIVFPAISTVAGKKKE